MNCKGCNCVTNILGTKTDKAYEFCGRTIRSNDGKSTTIMGCDMTCPQCKDCDYEDFNKKAERNYVNTRRRERQSERVRNREKKRTLTMEEKPLTKEALLKMLKRQKELNIKQGIMKAPQANSTENNNADANFTEELNLSNNTQRKRRRSKRTVRESNKENNIQNNLVETEEEQNCTQYSNDECTQNKGCVWDNENVICKSLDVTFYTQEGEKGINFKLPVGNYDEADIEDFEFKPAFMAVPLGLRVKTWRKSGFVGPNLGFLGNNHADMVNVKKNLYPIEHLGSIQICNMETCVKPSQYQDMQLISLIDGNNIDFVEDNVKDLGTYKESLREKIHRKLLDVRFTHRDCLEQVASFLKTKDIDITEDLSNVENSFTLQKIHYELDNLPNCNKLIEKAANNINVKEEISPSPIDTILENIPAPSFLTQNTNNTNLSNNKNNLTNNLNNMLEEEGNINFIIFIFVFLLIILLISALVYIYYTPK